MSQDPKPVTLHPTLEAALGCLDVDVDRELARYRRQRQQHEPGASTAVALRVSEPITPPGPSQDHDIANYTQGPNPPTQGQSPQTYLQSSEQLLNTLKDDPTPASPAKPKQKRGISPLALGAMGLVAITLALLSWAFYGPDPFAPEPVGEAPTTPEDTPPSPPAETGANGAPLDLDGPDLATEETPTASAPTPTLPAPDGENGDPDPAASPAIPGRPSDLTSALLPDPNSPIPAPEPSPTPAEPPEETLPNVATAPPNNDPYYYVVVGYDGEASLQEARGAIPDAYLRQFPQGIRIQMGAFDNAADAQRLVNALQSRGLVGEVHQGED